MNLEMQRKQTASVLLTVFFLIGCTSSVDTPIPTPTIPASTATISPPTASPTETAMPPTPTITPIPVKPTPTPTTGQVKGILIEKDTQQPVVETSLLLPVAEVTADGVSMSFHGEDDPSAKTDESGAFLFENVPPGKYSLVLTRGLAIAPLTNDEGASIVFEITGGKVVDLGTITVEKK